MHVGHRSLLSHQSMALWEQPWAIKTTPFGAPAERSGLT